MLGVISMQFGGGPGMVLSVTLRLCVATFPTPSVARTAMLFEPSARPISHVKSDPVSTAGALLHVTLPTADSSSVAVPVTVIGDALNVAPFAGDVITRLGGALSSVTVSVALDEFPARSVASTMIGLLPASRDTGQLNSVPENDAGAPWQATASIPESASVAVPVTVSDEVLRNAPSAGALMTTPGGVLSILRVRLVVAVLPAWSVAVPVTA